MKKKKFKKIFPSIAVTTFTLFLSSCTNITEASDITISQLRIGLAVDDNNPNASMANENFRAGLENHIGIPVVIIEDVTYLVAIEAMRAGNLDVMMASAFISKI